MIIIPIYHYICWHCGFEEEYIEPMARSSFRSEITRICPKCGENEFKKKPSIFKKGKPILDTSKLTGYDTDELTLGKIIDEGGIPYEFKDDLRKREKRVEDTKQYIKEVKARGKKYGFDPFSVDDKELNK